MPKKLSLLSTLLLSLLLCLSAKCQTESKQLYPISRDGKEGYINRTGRVVVEPKFDIAYYFSEGIGLFATALIKENPDGESTKIPDKWGLIDSNGEIIAQPQFKSAACVFSEGLLCVGTEAGVGFVDKTGKLVIEARFSHAKDFSEGLAPVSIDEKWGFVRKNGEIAIPPQFNDANSFSQGLALVKVKEAYAYINQAGQVVIHLSVTDAGDFHEGLARVVVGNPGTKDKHKEKGRAGYIDKSGKIVIDPQFEFVGWRHRVTCDQVATAPCTDSKPSSDTNKGLSATGKGSSVMDKGSSVMDKGSSAITTATGQTLTSFRWLLRIPLIDWFRFSRSRMARPAIFRT